MGVAPMVRRAAAVAAGVAVGLLVLLSGPVAAAVAADSDAGANWWFDWYGVGQAQAEGWTGAGVKVAVIDERINPSLPVFQGADLTVEPVPVCAGGQVTSTSATPGAVHGSDMVALLVGNGQGAGQVRGIVPNASVTFYGMGAEDGVPCQVEDPALPAGAGKIAEAIHRAVRGGAQVISVSMGGGLGGLPSPADANVIADAIARGVVIVASSGNASIGNSYGVPASVNGVVSVNALDQNGKLQPDQAIPSKPMVIPEVTVVAPGVDFPSVDWERSSIGTGSSNAAPLVAGIVAATMQKYPHATGNQVIQSLIHNTGGEDHPFVRDLTGGFGYGPASLRHMLAVDPGQYKDENPLMDKASGQPTEAMVAQAGRGGTPSPSPSAGAAVGPVAGLGSLLVPVAVGAGAVGLLVVIAVVVLLLVVLRRRPAAGEGGAR